MDEIISIIVSIIESIDEFSDSVYLKLCQSLGKDEVDAAIRYLLRNKDYNIRAYKRLVSDSSEKCFDVTNTIYIGVLNDIIKELNDLFLPMGFDEVFYHRHIKERVEITIGQCSDETIKNQIILLYNQFVPIRNKIVSSNMGLIDRVIKKYENDSDIDLDAIRQEATFGLMDACEKYDSSRASFSTLANEYIYYAVNEHLYDNNKLVFMNYSVYAKYIKFVKVLKNLLNQYGYFPSEEKLAEETKLSLDTVRRFMIAYSYNNRVLSIESRAFEDGEYIPLIECISEDNKDNSCIENDVFKKELFNIIMKKLNEYLLDGTINKTNYDIIKYFYLRGRTLEEIAEFLGLPCKNHVNDRKRRTLCKLRESLSKDEQLEGLLDMV